MSSLSRRIQKSILIGRGYVRMKVEIQKLGNEERIVPVKRGGPIADPDGNIIGRNWPRLIGTRSDAPSGKSLLKVGRKPRGSRRGIPGRNHSSRQSAAA